MPAEVPRGHVEQQSSAGTYGEFVQGLIDRNLEAPKVGKWYKEILKRISPLRVTRELQLKGGGVTVETHDSIVSEIVGTTDSIKGYIVTRKTPDGKEFSWHQPGIYKERVRITSPTPEGAQVTHEASDIIVLIRDPKTGEVLLAPSQKTFAQTPKNAVIASAVQTSPAKLTTFLKDGQQEESDFTQLLKTVGGDKTLAEMVRLKDVELFDAPQHDANRTTEKPLAVVVNVTDPKIKAELTEGTDRRWCNGEEISKLGPVLDGPTIATIFAADGSSLKGDVKAWFEDRLTKIGTLDVKRAASVIDDDKWKLTENEGVVSGVKGAHFTVGRYTVEEGNSTRAQIGIDQSESQLTLGNVSLKTSGVLAVIKAEDKVLVTVEPEPFVNDPELPPSNRQNGLARIIQFSAQKLNDLIEGKEKVDPGLAKFFDILSREGQSVSDMFSSGDCAVTNLPPAESDSIKATNLLVTMTVEDKEKQKQLVADGTHRWCTIAEVKALARAGKLNAHSATALALAA